MGETTLKSQPGITGWLVRVAGLDVRAVAVAGLGCVLAAIAFTQIQAAAAALPIMGELQYGEGIIYSQAARLLHGEPLYQSIARPPYTVVAYTPLYYWLVAGLRLAFGEGFWTGRLVSLAAGIGATLVIGIVVSRHVGSRGAGAFAGLLFLALGMPWVQPRADLFMSGDILGTAWANLVADMEVGTPWLGFYKEDVLGVCLALGAIGVLQRPRGRTSVAVSAALAALAFLTKQTLIAPALAGTLWCLTRDRRDAALFVGILGSIVGVTALVLEATSGAFLQNVVVGNVNPMGLDVLAATAPVLIRFQMVPLLLAGRECIRMVRSGEDRDRLLAYYWLASLLPLIGLAKVGSNHNHWTELAASTAILATVGLWRTCFRSTRPGWRSVLPVVAIATTILAVVPLVGGVDRLRPSWPRPDPAEVAERTALVQRVKDEPRAVLAAPLDLLALADRPILLEPYIYAILDRLGRWDPGPLVRQICAGEVGLLVFENPLEAGSGFYHGYPFWPDAVLDALQETMVLEGREGRYFLYVPRPRGTGGGSGPICRS